MQEGGCGRWQRAHQILQATEEADTIQEGGCGR